MTNDLTPLGDATASDIRDLKVSGLLLPTRKNDETLLVTQWDGKGFGVMLTGHHSFIYFLVDLRNPREGLFIPEPEILVDFSSACRGDEKLYNEGTLILDQNQVSVIAKLAGDDFANPTKVPLWHHVVGGSETASVGFSRWGIGIYEGDNLNVLWERTKPS